MVVLLSGCEGLFDDLDVDANQSDPPNTEPNTQPNAPDPDECEQCADDEQCVDGQCIPDDKDPCPDEQELCDDQCVDTTSDNRHCSGCFTPCGSDEFCDNGGCQPIAFTTDTIDDADTSDAIDIHPLALGIDTEHQLHAVYASRTVQSQDGQLRLSSANAENPSWGDPTILEESLNHPRHAVLIEDHKLHLALSKDNNLHHAHMDLDDGELSTLTSVRAGEVYDPSIAIDAQGQPAITVSRDSKVFYLSLDDGSWTLEDVSDIDASTAADIDITFDAHDRPHIVYIDNLDIQGASTYSLHRAYIDDGSWEKEEIADDLTISQRFGMTIDEEHLHLVFRQRAQGQLKYARLAIDDGHWHREPISNEEAASARGAISVAVDDAGGVQALYLDTSTPPRLRYVRRISEDQWTDVLVDEFNDGFRHQLIVDANGHPHIIYSPEDGDQLRYATYDQ